MVWNSNKNLFSNYLLLTDHTAIGCVDPQRQISQCRIHLRPVHTFSDRRPPLPRPHRRSPHHRRLGLVPPGITVLFRLKGRRILSDSSACNRLLNVVQCWRSLGLALTIKPFFSDKIHGYGYGYGWRKINNVNLKIYRLVKINNCLVAF